MSRKIFQLILLGFTLVGLLALTRTTAAQTTPTPPQIRPTYNYTESYSCVRCHFSRGAGGDHMLEAVGVSYDDAKAAFSFTGGGWLAAKHSQTNYASTQNTYCAQCHSPLQATADAQFKPGMSQPIGDGRVEGVTCAACHPSHTAAAILGRRLGIYKFGMDKSKPEAYDVIHHGDEDRLCLSCHVTRHNEGNAAFDLMYVAGVTCMDCHLAVYGKILNSEVDKRFHDFKVAKNLPYSCGVAGSVIVCHDEFGVESTRAFIPYMKDQHRWMWASTKTSKKLKTAADYLKLWKQLEVQVQH